MKQRPFGVTGELVSEIGLGAWQLGDGWGRVDDQTAHDIMSHALEGGVNFFDTADVYGQGLSEERIGRFLQGCCERIFVATKMGRFPKPGWPKNFSLYAFRQFIDNSLKRLGRETIDLMQIHCIPFEFLKKNELWEWLGILKKEGKVRFFGVSVESMEEALFCLEHNEIVSLQIIFNIFRQKPIETLFEKAKAQKMALIARLPLASGLLCGRFTPQTTFLPDDHRRYNKDGQAFNVGETFAGVPFEKGLELVEELKSLMPAGFTMAQMALRWILDFDAVATVIPGATKVNQVQENLAAGNLPPLSLALHQRLEEFYETKVVQHIRGVY